MTVDITAEVGRCFLVLWLVFAIDITVSGLFVLINHSAEHGPVLLGRLYIKRVHHGLTRMKRRGKDTWLARLAYAMFDQRTMAGYFFAGGLCSLLLAVSYLLKP